ncbi:sigma-54-dependent Fis family transcriptional regulator [Zobellella endophytica]|uniref:Sigma-54-dependent Fis family transcriptional regulator n=1 Tax=Zobellella endophytica TaxID=2116700 RepID=A0A2P7QWM6_9GAMM|nr:sigma-54 dependent transcriptional regulator [Zobellella endophytica]PSJ42362.1 sigma-54-dependent Fis family transcriptional regulator [Zobellella endophytica]
MNSMATDTADLCVCHRDMATANKIKDMASNIVHITDLKEFIGHPGRNKIGLLLLNLDLDTKEELIESIKQRQPQLLLVALVSKDMLENPEIRFLLKNYFHDFHTYPLDYPRLRHLLGHGLGMARLHVPNHAGRSPSTANTIMGESACVEHLRQQILRLSECHLPVLITGESGTGKELVAQTLHRNSPRAARPFIAVNCGALPRQLIQSELFGHEKGAFTGATHRKIGKLEAADKGVLFLDEIGDLPLEEQVNLLRFLQEKTIERVGSHQPICLDVRIVAATHVNLEDAIKEGRFREDLYFRLNVVRLKVPPLRARGRDIQLLAHAFLIASRQSRVLGFAPDAERAMLTHGWPGNVRELMNRVQSAAVMCPGRYIRAADLELGQSSSASPDCLREIKELAEREALAKAICQSQGKMSYVAEQLKISRATLYRLLDKHSLL